MRAIALSGGGDKGAFTVGVLKKMQETTGINFDYISGTSTGSLIAPFLAIGDMKTLEKVYNGGVVKDDILNSSNPFMRLITKNSLYNIDPLRELIEKHLTEEVYDKVANSKTTVLISTVCLQNGQTTYFSNRNLSSLKVDHFSWESRDHLIKAILASCAQPILMNPINIWGETFVDAGIKEYLPIDVLIELGCKDITGIMTNINTRHYVPKDFKSSTDIILKTAEIFSNDVSNNDLQTAQLYNRGIMYIHELKQRVQRLYGLDEEKLTDLFTFGLDPFYKKNFISFKLIRPATDLGDGLTFDPTHMKEMFEIGYNIL